MIYDSYESIMSYLSECVLEERKISKEISDIGFSPFDSEKKELKHKLKKIKDSFNYYNKFIEGATTFDPYLLSSFLVEYLSKNTDKRFVVCKAVKTESMGRSICTTYFKIICSAIDGMILHINGADMEKNIDYDAMQGYLHDRYIRINEEYACTLMGCSGLCSNFSAFPELMDVGKKLVDLKIAYPMMSDEERLGKVLGNTMTNCRLNWKAKSFSKKFPNGKSLNNMSLSEVFSNKRWED